MLRTRFHEASLVGVLSALAAFCALEARGGQPYSIVGQSTSETAATGRRPMAERIKAANRPIRIASEEQLAPDEGLIPALGAGVPFPPERDWTPTPAVVEFAADGPAELGSSDAEALAAPAVVPPPDASAVAANPASVDGDDAIGEVASIDGDEVPAPTDTLRAVGEPAATSVPPSTPQARRPSAPRRTTAQVTPQRRQALLERLRAALAQVPRPLGLVPTAPPRRTVAHHHARPAPARVAPPAQLATVPAEAIGAEPAAETVHEADETSDTATDVTADSVADSVADTAADATTEVATTTGESATTSDGAVTAESAVGDAESGTDAIAATDPVAAATDAPTLGDETDGGVDATLSEPTTTADAGQPAASDAETGATPLAEAASNGPEVLRAEPAARPAPQRKAAAAPRQYRAPASIVQRQGALDRLQARFESLPRPLGLLPAPRPSMIAAQPRRTAAPRTATPPRPAAGTTDPRLVRSGSSAAPSTPADEVVAADPAPAEALAGTDTSTAGTSGTATTDDPIGNASADDESTADATSATTGPDAPEAASTEAVAGTGSSSGTAEGMGTTLAASPLTTETAPESATTVETPAVAPPAPRVSPTAGRAPRVVERPVRDRIGSALAAMPRPFGILPQPQPSRPAAKPRSSHAPAAAPQTLAGRHPTSRPLVDATNGGSEVERAASPATAGDPTTLASGNHTHDETKPVESDTAAAAEPGTLPTSDVEAAAACIEVSVAGPEGAVSVGERVTLHLTIRNTGNAAAAAVTPVLHFAAGLEPLSMAGRGGAVTPEGSVVFDRLAELPAGEVVEIDVVAVCTSVGSVAYQGVAWCGEGAAAEQVPVDGSVDVAPARIATEPAAIPRR